MIAKLISHGATRDEARRQLIAGLEQAVAFGVTTNQKFLADCLRHPAFVAGEATTGFIARHRDELLGPSGEADIGLAALLLYVSHPQAPPWRDGRTLAAPFRIPMRIGIGDAVHEAEIGRERDGSYVADIGGSAHCFDIREFGRDQIRFGRDGVIHSAKFLRDDDRLYIQQNGATLAARDLTLAAPVSAAASGGDGKVRAAMNGRVVALLVKPGDRVTAGQPVMTLEAMKMEHVHTAGIAGVVSAIDVAEGEQVTTGKVVVEIAEG
jgi:geranyl-CoA carboxylase alpha subunit